MMIELPRCPEDIIVDGLSEEALELLCSTEYDKRRRLRPIETMATPGAAELIDVGFAELIDTAREDTLWQMYVTWSGWNALERIQCGIYAQHKLIDEQREARYQAIADNALYGLFS